MIINKGIMYMYKVIFIGTTWVSNIVSLLQAGENYDQVKNTEIYERAVYIEFEAGEGCPPEIEKLKNLQAPRVIKTHLPYRFVNRWIERDEVKTIVTLRNPKDTIVSLYHFYKSNIGRKSFIFIIHIIYVQIVSKVYYMQVLSAIC